MSNTSPPSISASAELIQLADAAASNFGPGVEPDRLFSHNYPWLYLPPGRPSAQRVIDSWVNNPLNIERVKKRFALSSDLEIYAAFPIVFTHLKGHLTGPYPGQWLVIIALGNLNASNGLVENKGVESLASGQDLLVDGNDELRFSKGGGGMAIFLILTLKGK